MLDLYLATAGFFTFDMSRKLSTNFQILLKERAFHLFLQPSALAAILQCGFLSCTLHFGQAENMPGHSVESRAY